MMHTEKPKRGMRRTIWAVLGLLLMVVGLAGVAFAVGTRPLNANCGRVDDYDDPGCSTPVPNMPATLTRYAEEVILTKAVSMVMPTATATKRPTSIPATPMPTKKVAVPTRTPVNSIRMAASPIIALRQCELKTMIDDAGSLVEKLDTYYENAGGPNNRIARGATLNGPTVFWMEVSANPHLPENVIPLSSEGKWGVFLIRDDEYTITIGEAGRYISLIVEKECPLVE
jgi:hypothetical protein